MKLSAQHLRSESHSSRAEGGRRHGREPHVPGPLITIITVVYNGGEQLRDTLNSVIQLNRSDVEYLVIDGGSTDRSVDVLREYDDRVDLWISEPDCGIYDAMNKGIALARGLFVQHLNIGDKLLAIPPEFDFPIAEDVACVAGVVQTAPDRFHRPSAGVVLRLHNTLHHQGCFYRRSPQLRYDTAFRVFSDFDLNQRLLKSGARVLLSKQLVASHDAGGISHTTQRFHEVFDIVRRNHGRAWVIGSFLYFKWRGLLRRVGQV